MRFMNMWFCLLVVGCSTQADKESTDVGETVDVGGDEDDSDAEDPADEDDEEDTAEPSDDEDEEDDDTEEVTCADSWVLTYGITGRVDITDTPLGIGNAYAYVGGVETDEIVLRIPDDGGVPAEGAIVMTSFDLLQDFRVSVEVVGEIAIVSYLTSLASDECGVALGELSGSTIEWGECNFGALHGGNEWSPDEGATGPGCISDYHVEGTVDCIDNSVLATCDAGWLDEGENQLDYIYNQPMLDLEFDTADLERFTMKGADYGTELPTYTNNRTWLSLEGELKSMTLEPTPACLCAE